ncbi:peptide chain release factor 2 [Peptostreptococcus canis]|uniref:Peptide chain release factor 2 n=1 Tax=Peptostreptococcus canis TaxID=1159213 RepID=A0ABR6TI69_9FIRM|nr:peptide chain release factor 2 [Peptostreptococcus canis]
MLNIQDYKAEFDSIGFRVRELGVSLDLDGLRAKQVDINTLMEEQEFWEDSEKANKYLQENKAISVKLESYNELYTLYEEVGILIDLSEESDETESKSLEESLVNRIKLAKGKLESMTLELLFNGEYDKNNAILSINPGTGGLDAQDWSQMMLRMYTRWAESKKYSVKLLDLIYDTEAGIKTATLLIKGENAYGYLKSEKGVHRLVRISPFDSSGKRHTSFASVDVMPEIDENINIEVNQADLKVDTYRASGAGGQHVNTTDSAVRITHIPTGVVVQCQNERSQHMNRDVAMKLLIAKLIQLKEEEQKERIEDIQGKYNQITWGSQIRSYVFQPYKLVKDHRTNFENANVDSVMNGDLDKFMFEYLKNKQKRKENEY